MAKRSTPLYQMGLSLFLANYRNPPLSTVERWKLIPQSGDIRSGLYLVPNLDHLEEAALSNLENAEFALPLSVLDGRMSSSKHSHAVLSGSQSFIGDEYPGGEHSLPDHTTELESAPLISSSNHVVHTSSLVVTMGKIKDSRFGRFLSDLVRTATNQQSA